MQQDTPLTDLCSICHVNQIKYTCPRDGVHTCSLPCVKRHKQRAQCSGVRNPAEYRKRSELATPSSVDKDFNFITAVERSISHADDVVAVKGIDLVPARLKINDVRSKWENEVEGRGIKLIRAPKGLSRSQQNKTHCNKHSTSITWTIEWLCLDDQRTVNGALETRHIKDLYEAAFGSTKRNLKKRKRDQVVANHARDRAKEDDYDDDSRETPTSDKLVPKEQSTENTNQNTSENGLTRFVLEPNSSRSDAPPSSQNAKNTDQQESNSKSSPLLSTPSVPSDIYFYLHRPGTESRIKCLIPLSPSITLEEALRNRTLIEFPTIYVRNEGPAQLQSPFMTEEEYIARHGADIPINVSAPADDEDEGLEEGEIVTVDDTGETGELSEAKVLEVLAKDLGS